MKRFIIYICGLLIILSIPVIAQWDFITKSEIVNGTVVELRTKVDKEKLVFERLMGGGIDYYPYISYSVDGVEYKVYGPENTYQKDDVVEVRYQPDNPEKAKVNTFFGLFFNGLMLVPVLGVLLWSAIIFSFMKAK